nr:hypothetical protein [Desulfobacterales bacterium]
MSFVLPPGEAVQMFHRGVAFGVAVVLVAMLGACQSSPQGPASPSATPEALTITPTGMIYVDAISHDARWIVGSELRGPGAATPKPLVRMDR